MMARKKKQQGKDDAYTEKVPQEVGKDKSRTLKSVAHEDIQHCWHRESRLLASIAKISYQIVWHMSLTAAAS